MRLEDDVDATVTALAGRGQRGANLSGMVAVVVHYGDAVRLAAQLETPVDAAKMVEPLGDFFRRYQKLMGNGDGGGGVEHIVASGHMQLKRAQRPLGGVDEELREAALHCIEQTRGDSRPPRQLRR